MITREQQMQVWAAAYVAEYMRRMRQGVTGRVAELSADFADGAVEELIFAGRTPALKDGR